MSTSGTNFSIEDNISPRLHLLMLTMRQPQRLMANVGRGVATALKAHFAARESEPNKRHWPKSHFWAGVARATQFVGATDTVATISIASRPFAHKVTGGTIQPGAGRKYLAIPLRAAWYGVTPREFPRNTFRHAVINGKHFLVERPKTVQSAEIPKDAPAAVKRAMRAARKASKGAAKGETSFAYILKQSVTHAPDARALPPPAVINAVIEARVKQHFDRVTK
ncbi:MAG: hypothetical protein LBC18_13625 [Opitutaceae bacterium]|jgi:hypothetical protein|nr:hypothetical protein [Opitutaceae bacterium]